MITRTCCKDKPHRIVDTRLLGIAIRYCEACREFEYPERIEPEWVQSFYRLTAKVTK